MGIDGLWPRLNDIPVRYAAPSDVFRPPPPHARDGGGQQGRQLYYPDVDLLGAHLPQILDFVHKHRDSDLGARTLGQMFGKQLVSQYPVPQVTSLHLDGDRSEEKAGTHQGRSEAKDKERTRLIECLDRMEHKSKAGKLTPKATMKEIGHLMRRLFSLEARFKEDFVAGLSETFPDYHVCSIEAEKCMAACPDEKVFEGQVWHRIVVSNDSDTIIYPSITRVLRKMPKSSDYGLYLKDNAVAKLGLPSTHHLAILGVVAQNDYSSNLPDHGLSTNMAILRRTPKLLDPGAILEAYTEYVRTYLEFPNDRFSAAYRIFVELRDTPIPGSSSDNQFYIDMEARFRDLKHERYLTHKAIQLSKEG